MTDPDQHATGDVTDPTFEGIIIPMMTPLNEDYSVDVASTQRVIDAQLGSGVNGVFVLGSTGEVAFHTDRERARLVEAAAAHLNRRVPLLVGCVDMTTLRVIEHARVAERAGADAIVVTAPFYTRTSTQETEYHFRMIHDAVGLPMFAYDIPVAVHSKLDRDMLLRLAADGVLTGVKDSSGDDSNFRYLLMEREQRGLDNLRLFTGSELIVDALLQMGADGAVPGLGNVDPDGYCNIWRHAQRGDWAEARAEQDRLLRLFTIVDVSPPSRMGRGSAALGAFKAGMHLRGLVDRPLMAPPYLPLDEHETRVIKEKLVEAGLL